MLCTVPGVPKIGPKTAADLVDEFGTLENLIENAHNIKSKAHREAYVVNLWAKKCLPINLYLSSSASYLMRTTS